MGGKGGQLSSTEDQGPSRVWGWCGGGGEVIDDGSSSSLGPVMQVCSPGNKGCGKRPLRTAFHYSRVKKGWAPEGERHLTWKKLEGGRLQLKFRNSFLRYLPIRRVGAVVASSLSLEVGKDLSGMLSKVFLYQVQGQMRYCLGTLPIQKILLNKAAFSAANQHSSKRMGQELP